MAEWPDYAAIEADGLTVRAESDVERTPYDDGSVRQAKRFSSVLVGHAITVLLDDDGAYNLFRGWAAANAAAFFEFPRSDDGSTAMARVRGGAGGIEYTARVSGLKRRWEAQMTIESHDL